MALSILFRQRCLHLWFATAKRNKLNANFCEQVLKLTEKRNFSNLVLIQNRQRKLLIVANVHQHHELPRRLISLFGRRRRMSPMKLFIIGFSGMILFMMLESFVDQYKRKSFSLIELLSWLRIISHDKRLKDTEANDSTFSNKYASILTKLETPEFKPSRIVPGIVKLPNMKITILQYQTCPFCCKVRAFLDYYGLPYDIIEVNPVMRKQLKFSKKYRKVPILLISPSINCDEITSATTENADKTLQINDSTLIISAFTSYLLSRRPASRHKEESLITLVKWYLNSQVLLHEDEEDSTGSSEKFSAKKVDDELVNRYFLMIGDVDPVKYERMDPPLAEERRWRRWVDDHFVHVLSPNIYRTFDEALKSFNYFSEVGEWEKNFSQWERKTVINVGAMAMYFVSRRLKKKYGLKDDVRESLYDSCNYWLKGIGTNRRFMGGDAPNLADLAVYGALSSIEGCEAFSDLLKNTKMSRWYFDVKHSVEQHEGANNLKSLQYY